MVAGACERPAGQLLRYIGIFEQTIVSQGGIGASVSVDIQLACHRYHLWLSRPNVFFQSTFSGRATNTIRGCRDRMSSETAPFRSTFTLPATDVVWSCQDRISSE